MADTPVKITGIDSSGKPQLKEFSTTDENYLAYQYKNLTETPIS